MLKFWHVYRRIYIRLNFYISFNSECENIPQYYTYIIQTLIKAKK